MKKIKFFGVVVCAASCLLATIFVTNSLFSTHSLDRGYHQIDYFFYLAQYGILPGLISLLFGIPLGLHFYRIGKGLVVFTRTQKVSLGIFISSIIILAIGLLPLLAGEGGLGFGVWFFLCAMIAGVISIFGVVLLILDKVKTRALSLSVFEKAFFSIIFICMAASALFVYGYGWYEGNSRTPETCQQIKKLDGRDLCYELLVHKQPRITPCQNVSNPLRKDSCFFVKAVDSDDKESCLQILSDAKRNNCLQVFDEKSSLPSSQ